jgi:hypothetical protein
MSRYPTLSAMGVSSFDQIDRYSIQTRDRNQILKIYYCRPLSSSLPKSKKFEFNHQDPQLLQATSELDSLIGHQDEPLQRRVQLERELLEFEQVMSSKLGELRQRLQSWQQPASNPPSRDR